MIPRFKNENPKSNEFYMYVVECCDYTPYGITIAKYINNKWLTDGDVDITQYVTGCFIIE